jgi:hypothetical protein
MTDTNRYAHLISVQAVISASLEDAANLRPPRPGSQDTPLHDLRDEVLQRISQIPIGGVDAVTLPARVRYAAAVLDELDDGAGTFRCPTDLRQHADFLEAQEQAASSPVERLARQMFDLVQPEYDWNSPTPWANQSRKTFRNVARALIEGGWREGDPS